MKFKEQQELVKGLRALADFIENEGISLPSLTAKLDGWVYTKEDMKKCALILRNAEKDAWSNYFDLTRKFGPIPLQITSYRDKVCTRKVVGTKQIEKQVATSFKTEIVEEEIVEWDCDPILAS